MFQIFVRWNGGGQKGYDVVEVMRDGVVIQSDTFCNNEELVHGYCIGVVNTMTRIGIPIAMPKCLQRHLCADRSRED